MKLAGAVLLGALCTGCTAIVSLDEYDRGTAASSAAAASGGAGGSSSSAGGAGGTGAAAGGCGDFVHPAAASLSDDFDDGAFAPSWSTTSTCLTEVDGQLVATLPPNVEEYCILESTQAYHLTCSEVVFRVDETTTVDLGLQTFVYITPLDGSPGLNLIRESAWSLGVADGSAGIEVIASYDPISDRWWKLRHDGTQLFFETSPDGRDWAVRGSGTPSLSLDAVFLSIGAGAHEAGKPNPGVARFSCINVPPGECDP